MKGEAEAGAGQGPCVQTGALRGGSLALDPELRGREQLLCGEFSSFLPSRQLAPSGGTVRIKVPRLGHSHTPCRVCDRAAAGPAAHRGWPAVGRRACGPPRGGRPWDAGRGGGRAWDAGRGMCTPPRLREGAAGPRWHMRPGQASSLPSAPLHAPRGGQRTHPPRALSVLSADHRF